MSWTMITPSVASGMMMLQKVVAEVMGMVAQVMEVVVGEVAEVVVKPKPSHLSTLLYHGIRRAELGKTESVGGVGDGASADQGRKTRFMPHLSQHAYEDL